jgi:uncharacterized OB-fold protein
MELPRYHRLRNQLYHLEGSRCPGCEARFFPPRGRCPECGRHDLVPHRFEGKGTLVSHSEVFQVPRGYAASVPYAVGLVRLDEGVTVLAQITDATPRELAIGMRLEAVTRKIRADGEKGLLVYGYKFRPVMDRAEDRPPAAPPQK